jgi:hypothetical protein
MDVVRLRANLPTRTAADFEVAVVRALTSSGIALAPAWLTDVVVAGQRVAVDLGFAGSVQCRGLGVVNRVGADGVVHVDVNDIDEAWAALQQRRSRAARPALLVSVPDAFVVDDVPPPAIQHIDLAHRAALLARMLAGGNDDTLEGDEPGSDEGGATASGPVRPAPALFDLPDLAAFPDAPPPPGSEPDLPRLFDRQSTDIDLLGEISASEVIALDDSKTGVVVNKHDNDDDLVDFALADLPSMDAELLEDTAAVPVAFPVARPLPVAASGVVVVEPLPVVAAGWTVSRRGTPSGLEHFGWPRTGTRREAVPAALEHDDGDVFSTPRTPVTADPYTAQDSDPSLDVENIVARNTHIADIFADSDDDLFRSSGDADVTRDEMPLPRLNTPPPPPSLVEVNTSVFHHDSSDERSAG